MRVATSETGAAWNEFFANPVARGLADRSLGSPPTLTRVSCDRGEPLPGAVWQRCRTHYAAKLMPVTPRACGPRSRAMLHCVYDRPDATSVHAQFDRLLDDVDTNTLLKPNAQPIPRSKEPKPHHPLRLDPVSASSRAQHPDPRTP